MIIPLSDSCISKSESFRGKIDQRKSEDINIGDHILTVNTNLNECMQASIYLRMMKKKTLMKM